MTQPYRVYGAEMSPYSVKVRSCFRYKGIDHRWVVRNSRSEADYQALAKIQIVPLVALPDGSAMQDSTPILEHVEARHADPSIHPDDPVTRFLSALLEEFGDEWGNKWMFHLRWAREVDQQASAGRIARGAMPDADDETIATMTAMIAGRMTGRVWFVGSNEQNAPFLETTFREALADLDAHLATRPYLFGARPSFGDFGLWAQFYEAWTDPTAGALVEGLAHNVLAWVHRMLWPKVEGEFESWDTLEPTMAPFLERHVGRRFLPWTLANAAAIAGGQEQFTVDLDGHAWTQKPQKYHAKSLEALRAKYRAVAGPGALDAVLGGTGCLAALRD